LNSSSATPHSYTKDGSTATARRIAEPENSTPLVNNWVMRPFPLGQCFNSKVEEYVSQRIVKSPFKDILQSNRKTVERRYEVIDMNDTPRGD
jgi:hypothetical protein